MQEVNQEILKGLTKPKKDSHKGQNGRVLIIAGSEKYHGALLMTLQTASRIVDMVYVYSPTNQKLIEQLKSDIAVFINVFPDELWSTVDLVDSVLIGPGLEENKETKKITEKLLKKYPEKKVIVDATALWHVDPLLLHSNCIVTPHSREFENVFQCEPTSDNVLKMAKYYQCKIILKGTSDYISDGKELWENTTGNVGMTKGGTGDVLAGTVVGLSAKNDLLTSALAGTYLTGLAGDKLYKEKGTFYNAEDVIESLGEVWGKVINN
ncbi:MAG TPA: NAD(P)H-hydrate dehydratase [Candidatus Magasanikbacteria bacterium]|nr:NAD(P)H-hydrate dehydratase [Candidatus Magasanikbacteria bacterium]